MFGDIEIRTSVLNSTIYYKLFIKLYCLCSDIIGLLMPGLDHTHLSHTAVVVREGVSSRVGITRPNCGPWAKQVLL